MAGTGFCAGRENGGHGDGGAATASHLGFPSDVEATPDGGFVLIERDRVRRVAPDGKISTVFVTGLSSAPTSPRPSPARSRWLPDGDVLIGLEPAGAALRHELRAAPDADTEPGRVAEPAAATTAGAGAITPKPKPLTASLSKSAYKVAKGKKLKFVFSAASAGTYTLEIRKGKKLAKRFKGAAKAGKNTVRRSSSSSRAATS